MVSGLDGFLGFGIDGTASLTEVSMNKNMTTFEIKNTYEFTVGRCNLEKIRESRVERRKRERKNK